MPASRLTYASIYGQDVEPAALDLGHRAIGGPGPDREHLHMSYSRSRERAAFTRASTRRSRSFRAERDEAVLREVRELLLRGSERQQRIRLERMERTARMWVNGRALEPQPLHDHLKESYD
jgi:hypothetical protein